MLYTQLKLCYSAGGVKNDITFRFIGKEYGEHVFTGVRNH